MTASSKTALIAGAAGLVGSRLLEKLLADPRYGRVIAVVRRPLGVSHPKLEERQTDFDRLSSVLYGLQAEDWFCCLGTTMRTAGSREAFRRVDYEYPMELGKLASQSGARRFLVITAVGSSPASHVFYSRVKGELERDLKALGLPSLLVFRPSLLLGERKEFRAGERFGAALMRVVNPLLAGPLRKYRGIRADAVAQGMIAAANEASASGLSIYESDRIETLAASAK